MMPNPTSIRISDDLKSRLRALADAERRSLTNYLEIQLERIAADGEAAQIKPKPQRK